ncbi:MAG: hypothetical protein E7037_05295 [Verrucomicrobia bacterium]|nr:hypothetical protein [Verrucomicrobiota bacterium]
MSKITIIGSSGAGKTVFISVLAERFSERFLPKNQKTKRYTAEIYGDLVDEQKWPDSTGAGQIKDLAWELTLHDGISADVSVLDTPGQDIQDIYSGDELTTKQKELKDEIDKSDVLVLFVNLVDIINGKTYREREGLKSFVYFAAKDVLSRNESTRVVILLSQHDQLQSLLTLQGLNTKNAREVLNKYIPELTTEIRKVDDGRVYVEYVASVADVETRWNSQQGYSVIVPAKNFDSVGLDYFMDVLDESILAIQKEKREKEAKELRAKFCWEKKKRIRTRLHYSSVSKTRVISYLREWCCKDDDLPPEEKVIRALEDEISEDKVYLESNEMSDLPRGILFMFVLILPGYNFCLLGSFWVVLGVLMLLGGMYSVAHVIKIVWLTFTGKIKMKVRELKLKEDLLRIINEDQHVREQIQ